ncbi:MAG: hypothetical protein AVDCRST_MAG93-3469, partial [uncultured Chloroflexia bacterium]
DPVADVSPRTVSARVELAGGLLHACGMAFHRRWNAVGDVSRWIEPSPFCSGRGRPVAQLRGGVPAESPSCGDGVRDGLPRQRLHLSRIATQGI